MVYGVPARPGTLTVQCGLGWSSRAPTLKNTSPRPNIHVCFDYVRQEVINYTPINTAMFCGRKTKRKNAPSSYYIELTFVSDSPLRPVQLLKSQPSITTAYIMNSTKVQNPLRNSVQCHRDEFSREGGLCNRVCIECACD